MTIGFNQQDYARQFLALMPRGRAWPKFDDATQAKFALGLCGIYETSDQAAVDLLGEIFPSTTAQLLPEWEETLGLPDLCAGDDQSIAQRRGQVVARFTNAGGQSIATLIGYAAALGFTITIGEDAPFRMGESSMGDHLGPDEWMYAWTVQAPYTTIQYFLMGEGAMGDPLQTFGNTTLECELTGLGPVHTVQTFAYGFDLHTGLGARFLDDVYWSRPADNGAPTVDDFTVIFAFTRGATGTFLGSNGLLQTAPINTPRIEYDATGARMGLLIEGAPATNFILQSEDIGTTWIVSGTTSLNAAVAPDGNNTADKFIEQAAGAGSTRHFISQTFAKAASAIQYSVSQWFGPSERKFGNIRVSDGPQAGDARVSIDLTTGTLSAPVVNGVGFSVQDTKVRAYPGGYYRVTLTFTSSTDTTLRVEVGAGVNNNAAVLAYVGDGASGLFLWGSQGETGNAGTSYIPTTTVPVTRLRDKVQRNLSTEFSQTVGTFAITYKMLRSVPTTPVNQFLMDARNVSSSNSITLFHSTSGMLNMSVNSGGGFGGLAFTTVAPGDMVRIKASGAFGLNDVAVARDGALGTPDASAPLPTDIINLLSIGNSADSTQPCAAIWIEEFDYYPVRKSNADLVTLPA